MSEKHKPLHNTDEHVFANILKRFKIKHEVEAHDNGAGYKIEEGYHNFYALWEFNVDGSFQKTGAYE
jgi:hypothetical protein